jgi:hypothetical protein
VELAEAISGEGTVDWKEESAKHPTLSSAIAQLQRLDEVASAFRALHEPDEDPSTVDADTPETLFEWGHLRVVERLGEGSFGEVYRAHDPVLDREVALKLRRAGPSHAEGSGRRFVEEARRLARVRHPNVLAVYGAELDEGRVGMWTELVRGQTLEERLERDGALGEHEAAAIGLDLCRALAAVHAAGLVHGDVKASNVIRERGGRLVLADFGSGTEIDGGAASSGSPLCAAPEVLRGEPPKPASDLYSLGVLLYRLVSGHHPVEAHDLGELQAMHSSGDSRPLRDLRPDLSAEFVHVVEHALEPSPHARYRSAGEMERDLGGVLGETSGPLVGAAVEGKATRWSSPRVGRWLLLVAAAVLAVAAIVVVVDRAGREVPNPARAGDAGSMGAESELPASDAVVDEPKAGGSGPGADTETSAAAVQEAAAARLAVAAALHRTRGGRSDAVASGATVTVGDQLHLEVESAEQVHVYVLNEDREGALFVLFPLDGLDLANPLPAGRHRLPGRTRGVAQDWQVTSAGGSEIFLVVASRVPRPDLEEEIARYRAAAQGDAAALGNLRGVGGLADAAPAGTGSGRLDALVERLSSEEERAGTLWLSRIELLNPMAE